MMSPEPFKILLIGGGGREHAIAWKLSQSPRISHIYVCPGNGGTASLNKTTNIASVSATDFPGLVNFARQQNINFLLPGPEQPLVDGIVDIFQQQAPDILCFGPSKRAATMEGSKTFAKDFMKQYSIPTATYSNFSNYSSAKTYLDSVHHSVVVLVRGRRGTGFGRSCDGPQIDLPMFPHPIARSWYD